ncbi:hypothetical protein LK07_23635 [Streptomyces pluripotens]|uniref:Class I SAM-dependent methyltransferase n=1 Tax=Streptomyces pluripotens TaxID=1355015 RepID=A0A221P361_9ACTN|nr:MULTISPECIES: hypothetical protein [Streptomyces]ARP72258.1 hypothetical protein LK06_022475 [Streptomyces pluripotens]ASN26506.1 hypothetical protein LK07_23635 [Streptomyces pluripotens]MCH0556138.1 hypothetical protein [Streptomyces sp. MUM 16J]
MSARAPHWLHNQPLAALYGQVAAPVRDGGVFVNADHMIDETTPQINAVQRARRLMRMDQAKPEGALDRSGRRRLAAKGAALAGRPPGVRALR